MSTTQATAIYFETDQATIDSNEDASIPLVLHQASDSSGYVIWIDLQTMELVVDEWTTADEVGAELYREALNKPIAPNTVYRFQQKGNLAPGGPSGLILCDQLAVAIVDGEGGARNDTYAPEWHFSEANPGAVPASIDVTTSTLGVDVYQEYYVLDSGVSFPDYVDYEPTTWTASGIVTETYLLWPVDGYGGTRFVKATFDNGRFAEVEKDGATFRSRIAQGANYYKDIGTNPPEKMKAYLRWYWVSGSLQLSYQVYDGNGSTWAALNYHIPGGGPDFSGNALATLSFDATLVMPIKDSNPRTSEAYQAPGWTTNEAFVFTDYTPQLEATATTKQHFGPGYYYGNDFSGIAANGTAVTLANSDGNDQQPLTTVSTGAAGWTYEDSSTAYSAFGSQSIYADMAPYRVYYTSMNIAPPSEEWQQMSYVYTLDSPLASLATLDLSVSAIDDEADNYFSAEVSSIVPASTYRWTVHTFNSSLNGIETTDLNFGTAYRLDIAWSRADEEMQVRVVEQDTNLTVWGDVYDFSGDTMPAGWTAGNDPHTVTLVGLHYNSDSDFLLNLDWLGSIADQDTVNGNWPRHRTATGTLTAGPDSYSQLDVTRWGTAYLGADVVSGSRGTIDTPQTEIFLNNMAAGTDGAPVLALTSGGESGEPLQGNDPGYYFTDEEAYSAGISVNLDGSTSAGDRSLAWTSTGGSGSFIRAFIYRPEGEETYPDSLWHLRAGNGAFGSAAIGSLGSSEEVTVVSAPTGSDYTTETKTITGNYSHSATCYFKMSDDFTKAVPLMAWERTSTGGGYQVWLDPINNDIVASTLSGATERWRASLDHPLVPGGVYRFDQWGNPASGGSFALADQIYTARFDPSQDSSRWHYYSSMNEASLSVLADQGTVSDYCYADYWAVEGSNTRRGYIEFAMASPEVSTQMVYLDGWLGQWERSIEANSAPHGGSGTDVRTSVANVSTHNNVYIRQDTNASNPAKLLSMFTSNRRPRWASLWYQASYDGSNYVVNEGQMLDYNKNDLSPHRVLTGDVLWPSTPDFYLRFNTTQIMPTEQVRWDSVKRPYGYWGPDEELPVFNYDDPASLPVGNKGDWWVHDGSGSVNVTDLMPATRGWLLVEIEKDWTQGGSGNMVVSTVVSNPDGTNPSIIQEKTVATASDTSVGFALVYASNTTDSSVYFDGFGWGTDTSFPLDATRLRVTEAETSGGVVGTMGVSAAVLPLDPDAVQFPTVKVEVAMGQKMVDGPSSLTWTDVTGYVRASDSLTFSRGRLTEGEIATPGQLTVTLDNNDGRFTPSITDGPYGDGFRARVPIRVTQVSEDHPLWVGYVTDIVWNGQGNDYVVQVQAVDTLGLFARTEMRGGYAERFRVLPDEAAVLGIAAERLGVWSFRDQDTGKNRQAVKAEHGRDGWLEPVKANDTDSPRFQAGVVDSSLDGSPVLSLVADNGNNTANTSTTQNWSGYRAVLPFPEPTTDLGNQQFGTGRSMVSMLVNLSDVSTLGASVEARMILAAWAFEDWRNEDYINDPQGTVKGQASQKYIGRFAVSGIDEGYYTFSYEPKVPIYNAGGAYYTDGRMTGEYRVRVDDIPDGWAHIVLVDASDPADYDYLSGTPQAFFANNSATLYVNGKKIINHAPEERPTGLISNSDITTYYNSPSGVGSFVGRMLPNPNAGVAGRGNTAGGALIMAGATAAREPGSGIGGGAYGPSVWPLPFSGLISWVSVWALDTPSIELIEPLALNLSSVQEEDNYTKRIEALALLSRSGEWLDVDQDGTFTIARQSLDANLFDLLAAASLVEGGAILPQANGLVRAVSDQGRIRRVPTLVLSAQSEVLELSGMFSVDDSEDSDSVAVTMKPSDVIVIENEAGVDSPIEQQALELYTTEEVVARSVAAGLANKPNLPDSPAINVSMAKAFDQGYSGGLLALELGDRVRVVDLPAASGFSSLEFTVEAVTHTVSKNEWSILLNMSPATVSDSVVVGDIINTSEVIR